MTSITIVIPTYNRKEFLKDAIESVIAQSFRNYECIITDNCSTDGAFELAQKSRFTGMPQILGPLITG
jgi:glycosyltransferase involved in cell wall biosynthesis